jgi:uncharacterized protein
MKRVVVLFILFCSFFYWSPAAEIKIIPLYIGSEKFMVEIADTPEKQMTGMMYREFIPDDFGMLFIHETESYRSFWMKNCRVHLDIIYLDKNKQIINIHFNVPPCKQEPCKTYKSERPARYVLELRGNRAKELNLKPGDTTFFTLNHL